MKNNLLSHVNFDKISYEIKKFLNQQNRKTLGISSGSSVRATGDKMRVFIAKNYNDLFGKSFKDFQITTSRKAMFNISCKDKSKSVNYFINIVTHRYDTKFNRPNITSVDRLINLYENETNYFLVLLISYELNKVKNFIPNVVLAPVEYFSWDCLGFGALGKGQIQIKKAKEIIIEVSNDRPKWMIEFVDKLNEFYINETKKILQRMNKCSMVKRQWKHRQLQLFN